jgi:hypothetical protein
MRIIKNFYINSLVISQQMFIHILNLSTKKSILLDIFKALCEDGNVVIYFKTDTSSEAYYNTLNKPLLNV